VNPIILEGVDCAGKTTLARELEKCGYEYIHNGPPHSDDMAGCYLAQLVHASLHPTVFDRFHLGEIVYGPLLRNQSLLSFEQLDTIHKEIEDMGGIIVICLPPWRNVIDCWSARTDQEHIKKYGKLRDSYRAFATMLENTLRGYIHYDYTRYTVESFARALTELKKP
jgi:hypothetical protein